MELSTSLGNRIVDRQLLIKALLGNSSEAVMIFK